MEYKPITIYCPRCGWKSGTYDGKSTMIKIMKCNGCGLKVTYNPKTKETKAKKFSPRKTSSGMMFL